MGGKDQIHSPLMPERKRGQETLGKPIYRILLRKSAEVNCEVEGSVRLAGSINNEKKWAAKPVSISEAIANGW